jgi:hypothetical protein
MLFANFMEKLKGRFNNQIVPSGLRAALNNRSPWTWRHQLLNAGASAAMTRAIAIDNAAARTGEKRRRPITKDSSSMRGPLVSPAEIFLDGAG